MMQLKETETVAGAPVVPLRPGSEQSEERSRARQGLSGSPEVAQALAPPGHLEQSGGARRRTRFP